MLRNRDCGGGSVVGVGYYYYYYRIYHLAALAGKYSPTLEFSNQQD